MRNSMLITFEGKRVIVAGAARGIGHAIAVAFAENGGEVIACDRLFEEVEKFAGPGEDRAAARSAPRRSTSPTRPRSRPWSRGAGGPVDVLVYVAGGIRGQRPKPLEEVPVEDFHQIVDANLTGAFLFAQAVAPGMKRAGKGRIVTISSRAAIAPSLTGIQAYASAKHGQLGLVRQLAHELGPVRHHGEHRRARVPAHQPGLRAAMGRLGRRRGRRRSSSASPCAAWGPREDIAHAVCSSLRIMLPGSPGRSFP